MYSCRRFNHQEGRFGIPLTGLTPPHFCACPKPGPGFPTTYVVGLFFFVFFLNEVFFRFVDIGINCLNVVFIILQVLNHSEITRIKT